MADLPRADDLADILRASPGVMRVMTTVRGLGLPDWRLFSGAVYQTVWNAVSGREPGYGLKDYDIGFFDPSARLGSGHFGLANLRDRSAALAGTLTIESGRGEGTRIIVRLPIAPAETPS